MAPIKAEDDLTGVLEIDDDDLDMEFLEGMLQRIGRSSEDTSSNPYYRTVKTVADPVYFINVQPLIKNT